MNTDELTALLRDIIDSAIHSDEHYEAIEAVDLVDDQTLGVTCRDGSLYFLTIEPA